MIFLMGAVAVAIVAAIWDWRTRRIPDWLTYGTILVAVPSHAVLAWRLHGTLLQVLTAAGISVLGALVCGLLPFLCWHRGLCGGGDVKLFAALGALLEPFLGFEAQLYSYYAAALFVPLVLLYQGTFLRMVRNSYRMAINGLRPKSKREVIDPSALTWFRLGPAVVAGCMVTALLHLWR